MLFRSSAVHSVCGGSKNNHTTFAYGTVHPNNAQSEKVSTFIMQASLLVGADVSSHLSDLSCLEATIELSASRMEAHQSMPKGNKHSQIGIQNRKSWMFCERLAEPVKTTQSMIAGNRVGGGNVG